MLALVLDDAEMSNVLMVAALQPIADCQPHDFTMPAEALDFDRSHLCPPGKSASRQSACVSGANLSKQIALRAARS